MKTKTKIKHLTKKNNGQHHDIQVPNLRPLRLGEEKKER